MASVLSAAHFHNEDAAFEYVEARLWPTGPVCPHCGNVDATKIGRLQGATTRPGLRKCYACRKPFTVRIGTIFESSHCPLRIWLQAMYLLCSSKKGISTRQLQRTLGVGMKTAWFLGHRIREAMNPAAPGGQTPGPLGGEGKTVEADETYLAKSRKTKRTEADGPYPTRRVLALVERGGNVRSMPAFLGPENWMTIKGQVAKHVDAKSRLVTDEAQHYKLADVAKHETVNHKKGEYVRDDVHTNTLEGYFSLFKRGLVGVYHHMSDAHLERYLAEFDFRQNTRAKLGINDEARTEIAVTGAKGKRLTYRTTGGEAA